MRLGVYAGYLFKKTRDGKWQKRWFETNGCFLTYYKVRPFSGETSNMDMDVVKWLSALSI